MLKERDSIALNTYFEMTKMKLTCWPPLNKLCLMDFKVQYCLNVFIKSQEA